MRRLRFIAAAILILEMAGCGDGLKRVPIQGKITAQGVPLDNAVIQFLPTGSTKGEGGIGRSDQNGNFTVISSRAGDKGIVAGEYKVRVSRLIAADGSPLPPDAKDAEHPGARESVPEPYSLVDGTTLKYTIPEEGGAVNIDIPAKILGRK
jgi:hypothetical protein